MSKFLHLGFNNFVNIDKVISIAEFNSAPVKRLVQEARDRGNLIDVTQGRRTTSVISTETHVIICANKPQTLVGRTNND